MSILDDEIIYNLLVGYFVYILVIIGHEFGHYFCAKVLDLLFNKSNKLRCKIRISPFLTGHVTYYNINNIDNYYLSKYANDALIAICGPICGILTILLIFYLLPHKCNKLLISVMINMQIIQLLPFETYDGYYIGKYFTNGKTINILPYEESIYSILIFITLNILYYYCYMNL